MTGYLRDALADRLRPRTRMVLQPGLLPLFQAFLDDAAGSARAIIVLASRHGRGVLYYGRVEARHGNESVLAISSETDSGGRTVFYVPRANIEGWFGAKDATDGLVRTLRAQGWETPLKADR